MSYVQENKLF